MARLAAKQQTGVALPGCYITAHGLSMAHLLNAAQAIFGPPGIFKWENLATLVKCTNFGYTEICLQMTKRPFEICTVNFKVKTHRSIKFPS